MKTRHFLLSFFLVTVLSFATASAEVYVLSSHTDSYEVRGFVSVISTTPGTSVAVPLGIASNDSSPLQIYISAGCVDDDRSCDWVVFEQGRRTSIVLDAYADIKTGYKIAIPNDAKEVNYKFNIVVQSPNKIRMLPVELKLGKKTDWLGDNFPFLFWGVEIPKACLEYQNTTINGTVGQTCAKRIGAPVWFIMIVSIFGIVIFKKIFD